MKSTSTVEEIRAEHGRCVGSGKGQYRLGHAKVAVLLERIAEIEETAARPAAPPSAPLWTADVQHALLDIAHYAYHIVDDSEADETDDHTKVCEALDRLEPDSTDPHERIAQLRAAIETNGSRS
jgi:hypothetical protein